MTDPDRPVLFAYDGSPSAAAAIAVAGQLLRPRKALVCHVDRADEGAARIAAEGVELARTAGFAAEPLVAREHRKAWRALLEAADRSEAGLIVAGAQGRSGPARAVLGSVSTALVHHASVPVLIVPAMTGDPASTGPLLLCYDGSEPATRAIALASALFRSRSAIVLNFRASWVAEAPALAGVSRSVRGMASELDEIADEQSEAITAEGVQLAGAAGLEPTGLSERATGPAWSSVLDAADEHSCAAIVLGSRGLSGVSAALGSVSNGVVHHSRRPVLVVPPEEER